MPLDAQQIERTELAARLSRVESRVKRVAIDAAVVLGVVLVLGFGLALWAQPPRAPGWIPKALMIAMTPAVIAVAG